MQYRKRINHSTFFAFTFFFFFAIFSFFSPVLADPTVSVSPTTVTISPGQKAIITLKTSTPASNPITCSVTNALGSKSLLNKVNGQFSLSPAQTGTYTFTCTDASGGSQSARATITVTGTTSLTPASVSNGGNTSGVQGGNASPGQSSQNSGQGQAPQINYPTGNIMTEANNICQQYSGFQSVYTSPSTVGGASSVPVDLAQLAQYLVNISRETQLTANEMRAADMIRFCRELPNIAAASNKLAQDSAKELKTLADNCYADKTCFMKRVFDADVQEEIKAAQSIPGVGQTVAQLILQVSSRPSGGVSTYDYSQVGKCDQYYAKGRTPDFCMTVPLDEDIIIDSVLSAKSRIDSNQGKIGGEFDAGNGVIGSKPCTKTFSGADPTNMFYKNPDCADYKQQPALINQEVLKQITALPYTQAYSPANILGTDQSIDNISTRIQNGNLIDQNISPNFGSMGNNAGGNSGGNISSDLVSIQANYNKILSNIKVITLLYDTGKAAYASSTSACKSLPVQSRNATIAKIDAAKQTYVAYQTQLTNAWNAAVKTPNESHINLITQINFDLKDHYNQDLISQVYTAVQNLLKVCVNQGTSTN